MFKGIVLFSCVLLSIALNASGQEPDRFYYSSPKDDIAVDLTTSVDVRYQFLFFRSTFRSIDQDLNDLIKSDVAKIINYLDDTISESLVPTKKGGMFKWVSIMSNMISMGKDHVTKRRKLNKRIEVSYDFNVEMKDFLQRMMKRSKEIEKQYKAADAPKDPVQLRDDIHKQLVSIIEAVNKSPVAVYVHWPSATIDGQMIEDFFSVMMARLRYHGYGNILTALDKLVSTVMLAYNTLG